MYEHICIYLYIAVSGIATCLDFFVSFFGFCFLKFRNALGNEKTAKLFFIFKCMRVHLREQKIILYMQI